VALRATVRTIVPYDAMVLFRRRGEFLEQEGIDGEEYRLFGSARIRLGAGLSGWVAENARSIVNGNPSVEPGFLVDRVKFSSLKSALAVPLEVDHMVIGVLTLYRTGRDAFNTEELTRLLALGPAAAKALQSTARETELHGA
jgi:GAF domain-containing protein